MQKVGSIVARHIRAYSVETIYLVGGTSGMAGMAGGGKNARRKAMEMMRNVKR